MAVDVPVLSAESIKERQDPLFASISRFLHHRSAQTGLVLFLILLLTAIFAPFIAPYDPVVPLDNVKRRSAPCIHLLRCPADQPQHLMGIDSNNRDLFSRIVFGSRLSLEIGIVTTSFAIIIGGLIGAISGYWGGWSDTLIMRGMDILMAFPGLLLAIAIVSVLGPGLIN